MTTSSGAFHAGDAISGTGIPAETEIEFVGAGTLHAHQTPHRGRLTGLTATETTAAIAFDAEASALEAPLDALPALDVSVSGGPGGKDGAEHPYFVTFGGAQADTNVPELSADSGGLSGGNHVALVSTAVPGGRHDQIAIYAAECRWRA